MLQALRQYYYERLKRDPLLPQRGWSRVKVSFALDLAADGRVLQVIDVRQAIAKGKKTALVGQDMLVPQMVKRTSGVAANFLCDNCQYILGHADEVKGKSGSAQKNLERFEACRALHHRILDGVEDEFARAILAFFDTWQEQYDEELFVDCPEVLQGVGNIVFRFRHQYAHACEAVRAAWLATYDQSDDKIRCIVSGELGSIARLHPDFKVAGAQTSGASLVSFNGDAFCSFGYSQGENAQTCAEAAFAYGEALRVLLTDKQCCFRVDDMTILCWSQDANPDYSVLLAQNVGIAPRSPRQDDSLDDLAAEISGEGESLYVEGDIQGIVKELSQGRRVAFNDSLLDPQQVFYILGLSPNAARLSVRFFMRDNFGNFIRNVNNHYERLRIIGTETRLPDLRRIIFATVNDKSRDKKGVAIMEGETLRSILSDSRYPASLLNGVELRIHAEGNIKTVRAAVIKAYYTKNQHPDVPKEVLTVSLNEESRNGAYLLGRLFSTLEKLQLDACKGIKATIRDRFFNSASSTPAVVFPQLISLAQSHLKKVTDAQEVYYSKLMGEIIDKLQAPLPNRLSLPERGVFQLGYYHQTQKFYTPSAKKNAEQ